MTYMEKAVLSLEDEIKMYAQLLEAIKTVQMLLPKVNPDVAQKLVDALCYDAGKATVPA